MCFHNAVAVVSSGDVAFGAAERMGAAGGEGRFAAEQASGRFGGPGDAQSETYSFSVIFRIQYGAFVRTERPQPRVVRLGVVELVEASAVGYVA